MDTATTAIEARGLGKCYHIYKNPKDRLRQFLFGKKRTYYTEFWANRGIDLDVRRGETLGIIGRNGAGKTTFLQMVSGTLTPSEGSLEVDGRVTALLELGSGFEMEFSGRENVFLSGAILGIPKREMEERFDAIAEFADIGEFLERPVKTYSKGMFVRLAFAVLASVDPDIFVVDEALAVGDAYFRQRCMRRFREMGDAGTTILYVSHDAGAMKRICDRVAWIDDGRLVEVGAPGDVVENYLQSVFGRRALTPAAGEDSGATPSAPQGPPPRLEETIPNIDLRLGDQSLRILGVGLYTPGGEALVSTEHGGELVLRMTVENATCDEGAEWVPGYILRNDRGEDVASSNTQREGQALSDLALGERRTIRARFRLPLLGGGAYTLVPTLARCERDGGLVLTDQIEAALIFQVIATRKVTSLLVLETEYHEEDGSAWEPVNPDPVPDAAPVE